MEKPHDESQCISSNNKLLLQNQYRQMNKDNLKYKELLNYFVEKIQKTKENLNDDDFDLTTVVNIPVLVNQIAKSEKGFDMEKVESGHHLRRNFAEYKRTQKEKVGDIQSRVLDRAQVQMHQQRKKEKNH